MPMNQSNDSLDADRPLLILLGGATCGGKSTLADRLQQTWPQSKRLSQDDFFRQELDDAHVWITLSDGRRHQDWEHLNCIDWDEMRKATSDLLRLMRSGSFLFFLFFLQFF
jgi:uridine kinase